VTGSRIDLNADLGEGGLYDRDLMSVVTSCNIACGGHAGNTETMRAALMLAKTHGVAAGAHPSFPDHENFGRAKSSLVGSDLEHVLTSQITELMQIAAELDMVLTHLKPHGALYNMAAFDDELSASLIRVLRALMPSAMLVGPPNSKTAELARVESVRFIAEGFADRAYENDGRLRDRRETGAVIHDHGLQSKQAVEMATRGEVTTYAGALLSLPVETICVHGDTPDAFSAAKAVRSALVRSGISICAKS